jgi:ABC-type transporter Mla subunit MlaD
MEKTLKWILLVVSIFAIAEIGLLICDLRSTVKEASKTVQEARGAIADVRSYTAEQMKHLRDPRNAKAIDAAIQTAAMFNATGRLINRSVIPRINQNLDNLSESTASLNRLIANVDKSVNDEIAPELAGAIQSSDDSLKELSKMLSEASGRTNASLDDIHRILSDPAMTATLHELQSISEHVDGVAGEIEESSQQMPSIAASLEKIAKTSSKYQKFVLLSQILSAIGRTFF